MVFDREYDETHEGCIVGHGPRARERFVPRLRPGSYELPVWAIIYKTAGESARLGLGARCSIMFYSNSFISSLTPGITIRNLF